MTDISAANSSDILQRLGVSTPPDEIAERLPSGIIRVADKVTMTAPTDGLKFHFDGHSWMYLTYSPKHGFNVRVFNKFELFEGVQSDTRDDWFGDYHMIALPADKARDPWSSSHSPKHPWVFHSWWKEHFLRHVEHFPDQSAKLPGLLSYYQTPEKRARDIRTPIKPGKYLKKFFGDVLSEEEIQTHAIEWHTWATPPELHVTQDPDEIEAVYAGGPSSCMSGDEGFEGSEHPSRVYAGPDLAVAYIGDPDEADGRAVVWPEKMIYGRMYGDYHRLGAALEAAGYRAGKDQEFHGSRLRRIYEGGGTFTVPYVDFASYASDDGEFLIVGRGEVYLRRTDGVSQEIARCAECEEVASDLTTTRGGYSVCDCCLEDGYFQCTVMEDYFPNDRLEPSPDEHPVSDSATHSGRYTFYCDITEMYYPDGHYDYVSIVDAGTCEANHAATIAFLCEHSGDWFLNDRKVTLSDGRDVADLYQDDAQSDEMALAA